MAQLLAATPQPAEDRLISLVEAARDVSCLTGLRISYRNLYNLLRYRNPGVSVRRTEGPTGRVIWAIRRSDLPALAAYLRGSV